MSSKHSKGGGHSKKQQSTSSAAFQDKQFSKKAVKVPNIANAPLTPHKAAYQQLYSLSNLQAQAPAASGKGKGKAPATNISLGVANNINLAEQAKLLKMFSKQKAAQNKAKADAIAKAQAQQAATAAAAKAQAKQIAQQQAMLNHFSPLKKAQNKAKADAAVATAQAQQAAAQAHAQAAAQAQAAAAKAQAQAAVAKAQAQAAVAKAQAQAQAQAQAAAAAPAKQLRPITIEKQSKLLCGQHTLNNIFQNSQVKFVSDESKPNTKIISPGIVNLWYYCDKLFLTKGVKKHDACNPGSGNYDVNVLINALEDLNMNVGLLYSTKVQTSESINPQNPQHLLKHITNKKTIGFLVNTPGHWFAIVNRFPEDVNDVFKINDSTDVMVIDSMNTRLPKHYAVYNANQLAKYLHNLEGLYVITTS
jgi:hypothetical protein